MNRQVGGKVMEGLGFFGVFGLGEGLGCRAAWSLWVVRVEKL